MIAVTECAFSYFFSSQTASETKQMGTQTTVPTAQQLLTTSYLSAQVKTNIKTQALSITVDNGGRQTKKVWKMINSNSKQKVRWAFWNFKNF